MNQVLENAVDMNDLTAWLERNEPHKGGFRRALTRDHLAALELLAEAAEDADHVVSGAVLVGSEAESAKNSGRQAKENLPTDGTNPAESNPFVQAFLDAPSSGATTMLDMARISSGFNPLDPVIKNNVDAYQNYIKEVLGNVMFHLELSDKRSVQIKEQSFSKLINQISDLFDGITSQDLGKIKDGLFGLAEAATSTKDVKQSTDLFVQNAIQIDDNEIRIFIYYSTVSMIVHDGKSTSNETNYTIIRTRLKFQRAFWNEATAAAVAAKHFKSLNDWLVGNNTQPGDDQQALCFEV